jgi:hypothetical protein
MTVARDSRRSHPTRFVNKHFGVVEASSITHCTLITIDTQ